MLEFDTLKKKNYHKLFGLNVKVQVTEKNHMI